MTFKISEKGILFISNFEGIYTNAYKCPANIITIGIGETGKFALTGEPIFMGMTITQQQAKDSFRIAIKRYEDAVNKYVTYNGLNQNMYDALVSFTYNCGTGALQKSTLLKYLNNGEYLMAADQFLLWTRGGGKVLNGLVRRRKAERELFLSPVATDYEKEKPYLNSLVKDGTDGQKKWANNRLYLINIVETGTDGQKKWAEQELKKK